MLQLRNASLVGMLSPGVPRCAVQRMANHSAVSTSSHHAPVSGRRRQPNAVGWRTGECRPVQVDGATGRSSFSTSRERTSKAQLPVPPSHRGRGLCPELFQEVRLAPPTAVGESEKWISRGKTQNAHSDRRQDGHHIVEEKLIVDDDSDATEAASKEKTRLG